MIQTSDLTNFIENNQQALKGYVKKYYPTMNTADMEDILQNLYLEMFQNETLKQFDPSRGTFDAWIYRILHNKCNTFVKQNKVKPDNIDNHPELQINTPVYNPITDFLHYVTTQIDNPLRTKVINYILSRSDIGHSKKIRCESVVYKTYKLLRDEYLKQ
jgi:RNA polymerase sigma factor (sigma-70 family)